MNGTDSLIVKTDIKALLPSELESKLTLLGEQKFRAKQIFSWLSRGVSSFTEMTDLGLPLRSKLEEHFFITHPELARRQEASDGTVKYLWKLSDGSAIESVLMRYEHGNTVCVSSQVGCRMGCAFCASTVGGRVRDLAPSEILDQVIFSQKDAGANVSNIVLMGIGEPLDNYDNVMRFLELVNHSDGLGIGMRHISLSTCGLPEMIDKLGTNNLQLTLSLSLHAPDDETRSKLMPVNRRYGLNAVLDACARYFEKTGRRISFEYALIDGVNDSALQAEQLAQIAKRLSAHINIIQLNPIGDSELKPSRHLRQFIRSLEGKGANVTVRRRLGSDIDAACGQLRRKTTL